MKRLICGKSKQSLITLYIHIHCSKMENLVKVLRHMNPSYYKTLSFNLIYLFIFHLFLLEFIFVWAEAFKWLISCEKLQNPFTFYVLSQRYEEKNHTNFHFNRIQSRFEFEFIDRFLVIDIDIWNCKTYLKFISIYYFP